MKSHSKVFHRPVLNPKKVCDLYSEKDGVPISYVCTTELNGCNFPIDIFYRSTPHPEFGNHYFGLYWHQNGHLMITTADSIEDESFECVFVNGQWHYSRYRHDFYSVGDVSIDGGRAYTKLVGNVNVQGATFIVEDGEFKLD